MELELESLFSIKLLLKRRGLNFNSFTFPTIFSALDFTHHAILGNVSQGISGTHVLYGKGKYWHQRTEHCCFTKAQIFQPFGCFLFEHFFVYKYSFKLYFYEIRIILSRLFCWIDRTWWHIEPEIFWQMYKFWRNPWELRFKSFSKLFSLVQFIHFSIPNTKKH